MLHVLSPTASLPPDLLTTPGAFAWWYVDALDAHRTGFVLIWSWGLPFLPGLGVAARSGQAQVPGDRPSLNLAWVERGRPTFYLLQEYDGPTCTLDPGGWRFAGTQIHHTRSGLRVTLDCPLPGTRDRLTGSVSLHGTRFAGADAVVPAGPRSHGWAPVLGPCVATARLHAGDTALVYTGPAYADRNHGMQPLTHLGIGRWTWGRATFGDETRVAYVLWPEEGGSAQALAVRLSPDGHASIAHADVAVTLRRRNLWGLRPPRTVSLRTDNGPFLDLDVDAPIDASPFYLRSTGAGTAAGHAAPAWIETCEPGRIDPAWMRPLVRMAVHRPGRDNSPWLPLFVGTRAGRWRRLLGRRPPRIAASEAP